MMAAGRIWTGPAASSVQAAIDTAKSVAQKLSSFNAEFGDIVEQASCYMYAYICANSHPSMCS